MTPTDMLTDALDSLSGYLMATGRGHRLPDAVEDAITLRDASPKDEAWTADAETCVSHMASVLLKK